MGRKSGSEREERVVRATEEQVGAELRAILGDDGLRENEPLAAHTTFRIGGPARWLALPSSEEEVRAVVLACRRLGWPWRVLGLGSNILAADEGLDEVIIKLADRFAAIEMAPEASSEGAERTEEADAAKDVAHAGEGCAERGRVASASAYAASAAYVVSLASAEGVKGAAEPAAAAGATESVEAADTVEPAEGAAGAVGAAEPAGTAEGAARAASVTDAVDAEPAEGAAGAAEPAGAASLVDAGAGAVGVMRHVGIADMADAAAAADVASVTDAADAAGVVIAAGAASMAGTADAARVAGNAQDAVRPVGAADAAKIADALVGVVERGSRGAAAAAAVAGVAALKAALGGASVLPGGVPSVSRETSGAGAPAGDATDARPDDEAARTRLVFAQAGATNAEVAEAACAAGLAGYEFASGIPGTVGGAAVMNAGAYGGEFADVAVSVRCLTPEGAVVDVPAADAAWGYRSSLMMERGYVVLGAILRLTCDDPAVIRARMDDLAQRRDEKQPLDMPSAGSTFKRPEGHFAGKLIQDAGLQGFAVGGAQVSTKHAGFVVNTGDATAADVRILIAQIQERVEERSSVRLEPEVRLWEPSI